MLVQVRPWRVVKALQAVLLLASEASWLAAWSTAFGNWLAFSDAGPLLGLPAMIGLLIAAALARRALPAAGRWQRLGQVGLAALGLGCAVAVGARELAAVQSTLAGASVWPLLGSTNLGARLALTMALVLIAWWRGIVLGRGEADLVAVEAAFRRSIVILAVLFLVNALLPAWAALPASALIDAALVVLFAGMVGMPLARVIGLSAEARHQQGPPLSLSGHWLAMLLAAVTALLLVTILLAHTLSFDLFDALWRPLAGPLGALWQLAVLAIALPLGLLAQALVYLFRLFVQGSRQPLQPEPPPGGDDLGWAEQLRDLTPPGPAPLAFLLPVLQFVLQWAPVVILAALVLWLLARAASSLSTERRDDDVEEIRDFVWSPAAYLAALRSQLIARLSSLPRGATARPARLAQAAGDLAAEARELYRQFLRLGAQLGRARAPRETAHEYREALASFTAAAPTRPALDALTEAYAQARYSSRPPAPAAVAAARAALAELRKLVEGETS